MQFGTVVIGVFSLMLNFTQLDVPLYDQTVDYKTACESVATVATLNYMGYDVTIDEFLDEYLDTIDPWATEVFECESNIFDSYFVGNPRTSAGWLCNPPVICEAVSEYFSEIGEADCRPYDYTGVGFSFLLDEVAAGHPVVLWVTHGCIDTELRDWKGHPYFARSHAVVLNGFDRRRGVVFITDSVEGKVELPYEMVKSNYIFAGMRSVVIK